MDEPLYETIVRLDTTIKELSRSVSALAEATNLQIELMRADLKRIDKSVGSRASQDSLDGLRNELHDKLNLIIRSIAPLHNNPGKDVLLR